MNIREYKKTDAIKCREIFISNVPKYFAQEELEKLDNWLDALHNGTTPTYAEAIYFYVLEVENEIIGAAGFYLMKGENNGQLNWGMVHADHHNKGYGKLLFDYRVNKIKEIAPGRQATLWTSQYTYAFFEKLGMKTVKITPNGFGFGFDKYEMKMAPSNLPH